MLAKSDIVKVEIGTPHDLPEHTFFRFHMANHHMVAKAMAWINQEIDDGCNAHDSSPSFDRDAEDRWSFIQIPEGMVFAGDDDRDANIISITLDKACQFTGDDGDPSLWITAAAIMKRILN